MKKIATPLFTALLTALIVSTIACAGGEQSTPTPAPMLTPTSTATATSAPQMWYPDEVQMATVRGDQWEIGREPMPSGPEIYVQDEVIPSERYWSGGGTYKYLTKYSEGSWEIEGRVFLERDDVPILIVQPAHLQGDPLLPDEIISQFISQFSDDRGPYVERHGGYLIVRSGEKWVLERQGGTYSLYIIAPGFPMISLDDILMSENERVVLPDIFLPRTDTTIMYALYPE